jgi:serine/threonine-protein kinase
VSAVPRKKLGRFEIVRVLGKGAMGIVYEGLDPRLNRRVAIKTILRSAILDEEESRDYAQRFVREAQAVARLTHPHIVGVYDFGDEDDITFIVMEFIDGKELKAYFDAGHRFDFPSSVRLMSELLDAMGYAHKQGVIHRDIKPANIMLDSQMRVKITDFGVARITESAERTQVGTMVGTPSYMSPEQIQGLSTDNRTDLFACGVILYQMITGEKPFTGAGTWTIYNQILLQDPRRPTEINLALPPAIDQVINKALAKNKDDRFRNAQEFAAALTSLLEGNDGNFDPNETVMFMPGRARPKSDPSLSPTPRDDTGTSVRPAQPGHEMELEFWRAVKDSTDPEEFETYLDAFPDGVYAKLAESKVRRLRGASIQTDVGSSSVDRVELGTGMLAPAAAPAAAPDETAERAEREQQRKQRELEARRVADEKARQLTEEKRKADEKKAAEAADAKRLKEQAEAEARRVEEQARVEAEAKRQALQAQAAIQAQEEAKRKAALAEIARKAEAERTAKLKAEAEAKRIADADAARKAAEARAKADAEAKAKAEQSAADARRKAAEEEARRKSKDEARRQAAEEAKVKAEQEAQRRADEEAARKAAEEEWAKLDRARSEVTVRREPAPNTGANDETVMMKAAPLPPTQAETPLPVTPPVQVKAAAAVPAQSPAKSGPPIALIGGGAALVLAIAGWFLMSSGSKAPEPVKPSPSPAQQQAPTEPAAMTRPADSASKGQQDDAARRERAAAEKAAADRAAEAAKADAEKAAARGAQDRAAQEKAAAAERAAAEKSKEAKGALQKAAPDRAAAERAAAERAAAEKAAAERANAEKVTAAERAAAERAAAERAAAERAAAERAAAERAAAERAAAERAAAEKAAAERAAADKAAAAAKAQAERAAAEKAAAERATAEKATAERDAAAKGATDRPQDKAAPKGRAAPARQN